MLGVRVDEPERVLKREVRQLAGAVLRQPQCPSFDGAAGRSLKLGTKDRQDRQGQAS